MPTQCYSNARPGRRILTRLVLLFLTSALAHSDTILVYVSLRGDDDWTGEIPDRHISLLTLKSDGPFRTLERALAHVRDVRTQTGFRGEAVVALRGGTYVFQEPLVLSAEDPAIDGGPLTIRGYRDEEVVLRGSVTLTSWDRVISADGEFTTEVDASLVAGQTQLFWRGNALSRARFPDHTPAHPDSGGFLYAAGPGPGSPYTSMMVRPSTIPATLRDAVQGSTVTIWPGNGSSRTDAIAEYYDPTTGRLTFSAPLPAPVEENSRFFISGPAAALDSPAEWTSTPVSETTSRIAVRTPDGKRPRKAVTLAVSPSIIVLEGEPGQPVKHVTLRDLTFCETTGSLIRLKHTEACRIVRCRLVNAGGYGVELTGTGRQCRVAGCDIAQIDRAAIRVSEGCTDTVITNNWIHDGGRHAEAAVELLGTGVVSNNLVHDVARGAMLLGAPSTTCERNVIHHTFSESTGGSAIVLRVNQPDSRPLILRENLIRDTGGYERLTAGVWKYPSGTSGIAVASATPVTITRNRIQHIPGNAILLNQGEITVDNNLVLYAGASQIRLGDRAAGGLQLHLTNNVFAFNGLDARWISSSRPWRQVVAASDRNVLWPHADHVTMAPAVGTAQDHWNAWRDLGFDVRSAVADPGFLAPMEGRFDLAQHSIALKLGFDPIADDTMGLHVTPERPDLPRRPKRWRETYLGGPAKSTRTAAAAQPGDTAPARTYRLRVPTLGTPIRIDGLCDEDEWPDAPQGQVLLQSAPGESGHALYPAAMRIVQDQNALYIGVVVPVHSIRSGVTWGQDDAVQLSFQPREGAEPLRLVGFVNGMISVLDPQERPVQNTDGPAADITFEACILAGAWSCEWRIPLSALTLRGGAADGVPFNAAVYRSGDESWTSWAPGGDPHVPGLEPRGRVILAPGRLD